jgi:putative aldouronate transport system permease protein
MAVAKSLPKATEEEIQSMERGYWREKFHSILSDWRLYLLFFPLFFFLVAWKYLPIASMVVSFKFLEIDSSFGGGTFTSDFIGFDSFLYLFKTVDFWTAFRNTFALSFYGLVFGFPFPIILALFFSEIRCKWFRAVAQVFSYLPKFISIVVMTTLLSMLLQSSNAEYHVSAGPIAAIFEAMGVEKMITQPGAFRSIFTVSGIWSDAGYGSIVYFAAILGISPTSYEAAKIDGANKMQQIKYVTFPGMAPTLIIMLILKMGQLLTIGYEKVYLLQQLGCSYVTSETVSTYVINKIMGQAGMNQGIGAAADMFNSLLSMLLVIGSNKISRKVSTTSLF